MSHHSSRREVIICDNKTALADATAKSFAQTVIAQVKSRETCFVALSGGSTPKLLYERLKEPDLKNTIPWDKIHFFVSDERCVAQSSEDSNFGNAERYLFAHVPVVADHLHPCVGQDKNPDSSASVLEDLIKKIVPAGENGVPKFDLILLGMGPDGHTASLFPGTKALEETKRLVVKNHVDKVNADRITFTFPLINQAETILFMVAGEDKAPVLSTVLESDKPEYPSQHVVPVCGRLVWIVDQAAAMNLSGVIV